ncbi:MAG: hypothetical protein WCO00_07095 [Rhodospirillaceae bacterium]
MADIFQEVEEDLRRDRYERLAKKYGGYVIALLVAIVAATASYVLWKNWHQARQQAATLQLAEAVDAAGPTGTLAAGIPALEALAGKAPAGAAGLARLFEAGVKARSGDSAGAVALYDALAVDGSLPVLYRDLAALLSVQQQVGAGDAGALSARLAALSAETSPWRFSARELDGLLATRAGDKTRAKTLFQQLADDKDAPAGLRARAAELVAFFDKAS